MLLLGIKIPFLLSSFMKCECFQMKGQRLLKSQNVLIAVKGFFNGRLVQTGTGSHC